MSVAIKKIKLTEKTYTREKKLLKDEINMIKMFGDANKNYFAKFYGCYE